MGPYPQTVIWCFALAAAAGHAATALLLSGGASFVHTSLFVWPRACVPLFVVLSLLAALSGVYPAPSRVGAAAAALALLVFAAHTMPPAPVPGGTVTPSLLFGWGATAHAGVFAAWRDAAHLVVMAGRCGAVYAAFVFFLSAWFSWWGGCLGALWALTATTPPLLWASDWVELITALAFVTYLAWAHSHPDLGRHPAVLAGVFPGSLLAFQAHGAWTFHHEAAAAFGGAVLAALGPSLGPCVGAWPYFYFAPAAVWAARGYTAARGLPAARTSWPTHPLHKGLHVWILLACVCLALPFFCTLPLAVAAALVALAQGLRFRLTPPPRLVV